MQVGSKEEFYLVIGLGLSFAGLMVCLALGMLVVKIYFGVRNGKKIKKLYEQERKNGQGGAKGKF